MEAAEVAELLPIVRGGSCSRPNRTVAAVGADAGVVVDDADVGDDSGEVSIGGLLVW